MPHAPTPPAAPPPSPFGLLWLSQIQLAEKVIDILDAIDEEDAVGEHGE
jgi:hypothetical protein